MKRCARFCRKSPDRGERVDAVAEGRVDHVVLIALGERAGLDEVPAAAVDEVVLAAEDVLHETQVARRLRAEARDAADVYVAGDAAPRHELRERAREVRLDVLPDARAAEVEAERVERRGRERLPVLAREELVAREEGARELWEVGRESLVGVVESVAREELVAVAVVVVHAPLKEVLAYLLVEAEGVGGEVADDARGAEVRQRERVEEGACGGVDADVGADDVRLGAGLARGRGDVAARDDACARVEVGRHRADGAAEVLAQGLVAGEEEDLIFFDGPPKRPAELVALELGLALGVEEVARVEVVVAVELVERAVEGVAAGLRDGVDLPAEVAPVLGAVGVGLDAELADGLKAERRSGGAPRGAVGEVVLRRAVEQVDVRARVLPVDARCRRRARRPSRCRGAGRR